MSTPPLRFILMADIIKSRKSKPRQLMSHFREITEEINRNHKKELASPLTITLGDEFQGVPVSLSACIAIIIAIEETIIHKSAGFKLRYVIVEGKIETPINPAIAYGMLGEGLTRARENLSGLKNDKSRFSVSLKNDALAAALNAAFVVYGDYVDGWRKDKDYTVISQFLLHPDYKEVAEKLGKTRSQIWKREKSLKMEPYRAIKNIMTYLGGKA